MYMTKVSAVFRERCKKLLSFRQPQGISAAACRGMFEDFPRNNNQYFLPDPLHKAFL